MKFLISGLQLLLTLRPSGEKRPQREDRTMAIDFNKPLQSIDGDKAEKIRDLNHPVFKHLVLVTDGQDETHTTFAVDDDGNSEDANGIIENVEPEDNTTSVDEADETARITILELPVALQPVVRHTKRGRGRLVKVREAPEGRPGKTVGIRLDSGPVSGDGGILWCFDKYVRLER